VIRVMAIAHSRQFAQEQLLNQTTNLMGAQAAAAIKPIIEGARSPTAGYLGTIISTVILLLSSTGVFIELKDSMNSIWGIQHKTRKARRAHHAVLKFLHARLLSLAMVFGFGFLLVASIFISGLLTAFQLRMIEGDQGSAYLAHLAIPYAIAFVLFAAIFKFLPDVQPRWKDVWYGALLAAALFIAGRCGLAVYFTYAPINSAYGAAGSLVAVLTWIYFSSLSLFFGAEFTKVWARRCDPRHST